MANKKLVLELEIAELEIEALELALGKIMSLSAQLEIHEAAVGEGKGVYRVIFREIKLMAADALPGEGE